MLKHILIFLSTYLFVLLLVSSEDQFRTSSSVLHAKTQPKNVAFEDLGNYNLQGSSTEWFWTNSGEKIPYSIPWAAAQPDNFYNNEPVLSVGRISMDDKVGFNDIPANYAARFACQKTELIKN
ncbi:hypothetical protein ACKWTF_010353 [Chironomus riparius]